MKLKFACAIGLIVALSGAVHVQAQQSEGVAAVVNDEVISTLDLRERSALILASSGIQPTADAMKQVRGQALRGLVDEHLQLQEAKDKKVKVDASDVDKGLQNIAQQNNVSVQQFEQQLKSAGVPIATLRAQIEAEIAWRRLINNRYGSRIRITNNDVQVQLDRLKANATKPHFEISEILLPAETEKDFQDAQSAAQKLLQEMAGGRATFPAVARQFSAAPSAAAGGDLGWLADDELRPDLAAAVRQLKPGQMSNPIRVPNGVEIIALRAARQGLDPKTVMHVKLRQVSAPAKSREELEHARLRVRGCSADLDRAVHNISGGAMIDLGDTAESDLAESTRQLVAGTAVGRATPMFDASNGPAFMVVCDRDTAEGLLPSRSQIEDQMYETELGLLSDRYMMDLRRESTIITR